MPKVVREYINNVEAFCEFCPLSFLYFLIASGQQGAIPGNSGSKRETFFIMLVFYGVITEHKDKRDWRK